MELNKTDDFKKTFKALGVFVAVNLLLITLNALFLVLSAASNNVFIAALFYAAIIIIALINMNRYTGLSFNSKDYKYLLLAVVISFSAKVISYYFFPERNKLTESPGILTLNWVWISVLSNYLVAIYHENIYRVRIANYISDYYRGRVLYFMLAVAALLEIAFSFYDFSVCSGFFVTYIVLAINFARRYYFGNCDVRLNAFLLVTAQSLFLANYPY